MGQRVTVDTLKTLVQLVTEGVATFTELAAALIIAVAVLEAVWRSARVLVAQWATRASGTSGLSGIGAAESRTDGADEAKQKLRLRLGRWLAVSLEFLLAADILRTAIAPSWQDIGQLGAIAFIRTALNYFLQKETEAHERQYSPPAPPAD